MGAYKVVDAQKIESREDLIEAMTKDDLEFDDILDTLEKSRVPLNTSRISELLDSSWKDTKEKLDKLESVDLVEKEDKGNEILWEIDN